MNLLPRTAALAVAALAVTTALTACSDEGGGGNDDPAPGGGDDDRSAGEVLDAATAATLDTRQFATDFTAALEIAGQNLELTAEGRVDYDAIVSDLTLAIDQDGATQSVSILSDGETAWVSAEGGDTPEFPDGATYVAGDASTLGESDTFNPGDLLGVVLVLRAGDDADEGETEEIDGVETRQYSFTTPYDEAVDAAGDDAETFQSALSLTGDAETADLDVDVWVGPDDVVRRLELDIDGNGAAIGGSYDLELTDVGEDVEAPEAPAEDEVATGEEAEALFDQLVQS